MATGENLTILFTDLVGSTELAAALSVEAGELIRREHFSVLRQAIAATGGTEVKTTGDGFMVVFTSASAALECAVTMQQAVKRSSAAANRPILMRVGMSAGEVIGDAGDYYGEPVVEAARLCGRADGGQILVADVVRALAGRRYPRTFIPLGQLELKGLPERVFTLELDWTALASDETGAVAPAADMALPVPLPARLEATPPIGFIGREAELALLTDSFKRASAGDGREVLLISGEPGIGKTTLATQLARTAFDAGAIVLLGRCDEELGAPYGPFVEALSHYVAHAAEEVLQVHVDTFGAELAQLAPILRELRATLPSPQSTDPETERYLLYRAVVGLVQQVAESRPLILVIDDLQWADKPSLQLLRHLVANTTRERLLIVGTYRNDEFSGVHPLAEALAALRREPRVDHFSLTGLGDAEVVAFMEAAAGHDLDESGVGLALALYRETDGNPFFVWEVLRQLSETGAIVQDDSGRWTASVEVETMAIPETVRLVIGSRVARLGPTVSQVLPLAAVMGREFELDLLARVADLNEDHIMDVLEAAAGVSLIGEVANTPGRYAFAHALTQHTLYQELGATRRARIHHQVAEAVESVSAELPCDRIGELAYHWCNAPQPANAGKAVNYARRAGEAALASLAPDEAVRHFSEALRLVELAGDGDSVAACDLRVDLGRAEQQAGISGFRETFLDAANRALALDATDPLIDAALANTRGWFSASGVVDVERIVVIEAALNAIAAADCSERALLLGTLCQELSFGPLDRRVSLAADAKAMARRLGDPTTLVRVLSKLDNPLQIPFALEDRRADANEALGIAESLGDPELLFHTLSMCQVNAIQAGDFAAATACMDRMSAINECLRHPTLAWMTMFKEAGMAVMMGEPERAEEAAGAAVAVGTDSGQPDALTIFGSQVMFARMEQGRLGELVGMVDKAVADNPGLPGFRAILAATHLDAGNHSTALAILEQAAGDGFASLPLDFVWMIAVTGYALVASELRAAEPAERLYDLLAPHDRQIPFIGTVGYFPCSWSLGALAGVLGRYDAAETHFAAAAELCARGSMRYYSAATDLAWGRMLIQRRELGDVERGRSLLAQAQASASRCGYTLIGQRAESALSAADE